ncbi:MAG TPA: hypothetical protein PLJ21_03520, partial [Pseudobdellovibrionaceae bacterium]|nr:hypothetical protein [Pseudobdellovibrionaceae bacterium]
MKHFLLINIFFISFAIFCINLNLYAQSNCETSAPCEPYAQVTFTQKGLEGLSQLIITQLFDQIKSTTNKKINLENKTLIRKDCQKIEFNNFTDVTKELSKGCFGFDFSNTDPTTGETEKITM